MRVNRASRQRLGEDGGGGGGESGNGGMNGGGEGGGMEGSTRPKSQSIATAKAVRLRMNL